jgi:hypothetical protein
MKLRSFSELNEISQGQRDSIHDGLLGPEPFAFSGSSRSGRLISGLENEPATRHNQWRSFNFLVIAW